MPQHRSRRSHARTDLVRILRGGMEVVVIALAVLTPWAFGGVDPVFELAIAAGLALLLVLWAALAVAAGHLAIIRCPVTLVLALIFLVGLAQLVPMPQSLLGWVSPGAGAIRAEYYPAEPEQLTPAVTAAGAPGWPIASVYPHATRSELFRWLGLLVLFAAVRNQVATTGSLWRLSLVMLVNGCLLAVFGLVQAFHVNPRMIYGAYAAAEPFGPFINRNHFAAYMNMCIGLGVGLLVWLGPTEQDRKQRYMVKPNALEEQREVLGVVLSPFAVLHSPPQLWTLVGLALMLGAALVSLSRGGFVSLFIALIATLCLRLSWPIRIRRLEVVLIPAILLVGLFAWVGFRPLETRLATTFKVSDAISDTRVSIWTNLLALAPRFWLIGSGYGTLGYVEPLTRQPTTFGGDPTLFVDHAHNDYLEALLEGGVLRAGLTVILVGLIFAAGLRGLRRYTGRTPGALAVGAMTGFLAIALHSAVDFSMTTPAVAILAAVVVAQLISLNRADPTRCPADDTMHVNVLSLGAVSASIVGLTAILLGGLLVAHTWQTDHVYRLKLEAFRAVQNAQKLEKPNPESASSPTSEPNPTQAAEYRKRGLEWLKAAAAAAPDDADLQSDLGQQYLDVGRDERGLASKPLSRHTQDELFQDYTVPGLMHFSLARRACPLLARPHMRFAAHSSDLIRADPARQYWDRALKLASFDPDLWYFAGLQALRDKRTEEAWKDWRTSLELTPKPQFPDHWQKHVDRLTAMINAALPFLSTDPRSRGEQLLKLFLPDRPDDLVAAAKILDPTLAPNGSARPILDHALALLNADRPEGLTAEQYYLKAQIEQAIGEPDAAIRAYGQALLFAPNQFDWRMEFVKLLKEQQRWADAQRELAILAKRRPESKVIQDWIQEVDRERKIAEPPH